MKGRKEELTKGEERERGSERRKRIRCRRDEEERKGKRRQM